MRCCYSLPARIAVVVFVAAAAAGWAPAQEKIALKLNMSQGDTRAMQFVMDLHNTIVVNDQKFNMKMSMGMEMTVDVKDVDAAGVHTMDFTYDRIKMKMSGPVEVDFDSAKDDSDDGALSKVFGALKGQTITTVMLPSGKVNEVRGLEELSEKLGVPQSQMKAQGDQMTQMMAALPTSPVGVGDSWKGSMNLASDPNLPATVDVTYTLTAREEGDAVVKLAGAIKSEKGLNGEMSGVMRIDEKTGWTESGKMTMKMKGMVGNGASVDMVGEIKFGGQEQE